MPPLQTLVTAFSGLAIGAIICALIVIRGIGWRSVVGTFLICAIGFLGSCVGTLVRSNATRSTVGRGTAFVLYLPVASGEAEHASEPNDQLMCARQGERALIVEDEPIVLNALVRQLSRLGIESESAECGKDAIAKLAVMPAPPTIALINLHLRGMNGCDVAYALRSRLAEIPIVIMSGNFGDYDLTKFRADPKVRLLAKPARAEELAEALLSLNVLVARERDDAVNASSGGASRSLQEF